MLNRIFISTLIAAVAFCAPIGRAQDKAAEAKPIRALLVCGGCCHDYEKQKVLLSEGISKRANVTWTIVHEGKEREARVSIYSNPDWAKGYDIVLHDECFGFVDDEAYIKRICKPHQDGLPAIFLHCSTHSYRKATINDWRDLLGVTSDHHEKAHVMEVKPVKAEHPIMKGFPASFTTPVNDEMYVLEKTAATMTPLATSYCAEKKADMACIWINNPGTARVFATTLGHDNKVVGSDVYLDLVTRGLLWTVDKLDDEGKPKAGYGGK